MIKKKIVETRENSLSCLNYRIHHDHEMLIFTLEENQHNQL